MDRTNEIEMVEVDGNVRIEFSPLKRFVRYLTFQEIENRAFLFFYVLLLIGSFIVIILALLRRTLFFTAQDAYNELCNFIAKKDTVRCVQMIKKHPHLINRFCGNSRYTPFLRACMIGNTMLVKFMISAGADVHLKSLNGESAFYLAAYYHVKNPATTDATCIHTLYYAGVNINEPNSKGLNPLQLAAYFGHHRLVKWLLKKRANLRVTPNPYTLARQQGHLQTARILQVAMNGSNNVS